MEVRRARQAVDLPGWQGPARRQLDRQDVDCRYQITPPTPIGDVRVMTYGPGMPVVGYQITSDTKNNVTREYRQARYCVPVAGPQ
jgi:hypothetical protein